MIKLHTVYISHPRFQQIKHLLRYCSNLILLEHPLISEAPLPSGTFDILITDRIPAWSLTALPFQTILLSDSECFEEAVEALNAGVTRFLLWKDREKLAEFVRQLVSERDVPASDAACPGPDFQALCLDALLHPNLSEEFAQMIVSSSGLNLNWNSYTVFAVEIVSFELNKRQFEELQKKIFREMVAFTPPYYLLFFQPNLRIIGLVRDLEEHVSDRKDQCQLIKREIARIERENHCLIHFGIGQTVRSLTELSISYQTALRHTIYDLDLEQPGIAGSYEFGSLPDLRLFPVELADVIGEKICQNEPYQEEFLQIIQALADYRGIQQDGLKFSYLDLVYRVSWKAIHYHFMIQSEQTPYLMRFHAINTLRDFKLCSEDFLDAMSSLVRRKSLTHSQALVDKAKKYVENHYQDPELSLQEVAQHVFVTPQYLSRLFKGVVKVSFTEYVTHYRMQKAVSLLEDVSSSIHTVASEVGYHDSKYFAVCFKKSIGLSPTEFRKNPHCRKRPLSVESSLEL